MPARACAVARTFNTEFGSFKYSAKLPIVPKNHILISYSVPSESESETGVWGGTFQKCVKLCDQLTMVKIVKNEGMAFSKSAHEA